MEGWILLHRKIQESRIWNMSNQPFDVRSAWVDLLLLANHADVETLFDYKPLLVKRGQYLTSVRKLSARWSWSKDRTLKFLRLLESERMIHRDSTNQRTLITIENYDIYQCEQDTNKDATPDTTPDAGTPQTNNVKNEKNEKKNIYGEYKHVRLTQKEYDRLVSEFGEEKTLAAIRFLDEYKQRKGYKSKDDNLTLRKWVFDAVKQEKTKGSGQANTKVHNFNERKYDYDELMKGAIT